MQYGSMGGYQVRSSYSSTAIVGQDVGTDGPGSTLIL